MRRSFEGIRRALRIGVVQRELDEELAFHFAATVDELMSQGKNRGEAEEEARRRFGDERQWRRELLRLDQRAASWTRWARRWEIATDSVSHAFRRMRRAPGFALAVILTFALGIGANATMFGVVDRLLLSPPAHVRDADTLMRVMVERFPGYLGSRRVESPSSYPDYLDWTGARSFASVASYADQPLTLGRGQSARAIDAQLVTGSYWNTLGTAPQIGRFFGPDEDRAGGPQVIVISHGMWQRDFGGSSEVLGRTVDFGYGPYEIIGVAPQGFTGVDLGRVDAWLPMVATRLHQMPDSDRFESRNTLWLEVVARVAPGADPATAAAEATSLHLQGRSEQLEREQYDPQAKVVLSSLIRARGPQVSQESVVAKWLAGISLIVLLIACANVANLLLARAVRQRREVGIRLALGSSRARVLGQVLTESLVLALLGGVAALLVTRWGGDLIRSVLLPEVEWGGSGVQARVALVIVALALLAGISSGIIPALQTSRPRLTETLKSSSRGTSSGSSRTREGLTILQAALSVMLLVGAGLFLRSLNRVQVIDIGVELEGVFLFRPVFASDYPREREADFARRASARLDELPEVVAASPDISIPFRSMTSADLTAPGLDSIPVLSTGRPAMHVVEPDYFTALGLDIGRGRGFGPGDVNGAEPVMVINQTMAHAIWPGQEALGKCLILGGSDPRWDRPGSDPAGPPCLRIVGIVEDSRRFRVQEDPTMSYYLPLAQRPDDIGSEILIRIRGGTEAVMPGIRRELLALDPGLRSVELESLAEVVSAQSRPWRMGAAVFTAFGLLALVVAGIGLYSVLAFSVASRTLEMGIRAALGATRRSLVRLVLWQALRLAAIGVGVGLGIALLASGRLQPLLFGVSSRDPVIYAVVGLTLCAVAALAGVLPALRATRVGPGEALRAE